MNISKRELFRFEKKTEGFLPDDFGVPEGFKNFAIEVAVGP